jgi:hypothetical protein
MRIVTSGALEPVLRFVETAAQHEPRGGEANRIRIGLNRAETDKVGVLGRIAVTLTAHLCLAESIEPAGVNDFAIAGARCNML